MMLGHTLVAHVSPEEIQTWGGGSAEAGPADGEEHLARAPHKCKHNGRSPQASRAALLPLLDSSLTTSAPRAERSGAEERRTAQGVARARPPAGSHQRSPFTSALAFGRPAFR